MRGLFIILIAKCILWCFFLYLTHTLYTKFSWEMAQPKDAQGQSLSQCKNMQVLKQTLGINSDWVVLGGQTLIVFLTTKPERLSINWEHDNSRPHCIPPVRHTDIISVLDLWPWHSYMAPCHDAIHFGQMPKVIYIIINIPLNHLQWFNLETPLKLCWIIWRLFSY